MNVLGLGPFELLLILALALVVLGPEKLPEAARRVGRIVGELRRMSAEVTTEVQRSLDDGASGGPPAGRRYEPPRPAPPREDGPRPPY